MTIDNK